MSRRIVSFEVLVIFIALLAALLAYPHLPPHIPTQWGLNMQPNGYSSRNAIFWLGPGLLSGILLFTWLAPWLSPARYNVKAFASTWQVMMLLVFCLLACFFAVMLRSALVGTLDSARWMAGIFCVFLVAFGNLLGKVRPNFFLGVRTPWTLGSEAVWIATHRIAAWLTVLSGLCGLGLVLAGLPQWFLLPFVLALAISAAYSLVLEKRKDYGNG